MTASLDQLLEDGVIDEVLARLKSGKEADVWLVRHRSELIAAKVYKDRAQRSFKNSSGYKEGRAVRNSRTQRAMDKGSRFGQNAAEDAWKSAESDALSTLYAVGVRVPAPVLFYEGILLMELVLDEEGQPAPRLIDAHVPLESAAPLYEDLRAQAVKMLCCDLIHGDLSPYNVLLGALGPTIIDFPQVVGASHNSQAEAFFTRDIENLRTFFAAADPALLSRKSDAAEIWRAYVKRDLAPDFVPTGRALERPAQHRAPRPEAEARRHPAQPAGAPRQHAEKAPAGPRAHGAQGRPDSRPQGAQGRPDSRPQGAQGRPDSRPQGAHGRPDSRQGAHGRPDARPQHKPHEAPRPAGGAAHNPPRPHGGKPQHDGARPHAGPAHAAPRPPAPSSAAATEPRPHGARPPQEPRPHGARPQGGRAHRPAHGAVATHGAQAQGAQTHAAQAHGAQTPGAQTHAAQTHAAQAHGAQAHGAQTHAAPTGSGQPRPPSGTRPHAGDRGQHRQGRPGGQRGAPGAAHGGQPAGPVVERVERKASPPAHGRHHRGEPKTDSAPREGQAEEPAKARPSRPEH